MRRPLRRRYSKTPPLGEPCCYFSDTRLLRELMRGRRDDVFAFVGTPSPRAGASREWLHDFALREDGPWLAIRLALFASAGMAPYEVVVGRLREPAA